MNALGSYAFGTLRPLALANVAAGCMNAVVKANQPLSGLGVTTVGPVSNTLMQDQAQRDRNQALLVAGIGTAVLALVGLRFAAAWYVGKQFRRPVAGALVGGFFGVPGLGVLSFFPGD